MNNNMETVARKSGRARKCVVFASTVDASKFSVGHEIDVNLLWYTREDCDRFTDEFHDDVDEMIDTSRDFADELEHILSICQSTGRRRGSKEGNDKDSEAIPSSIKYYGLTYYQHVGLERFVSSRITGDKRYRRIEQWDAVYDIQDSGLDYQTEEKLLRHTCELLSRPSRLFAQALAHAAMPPSETKLVEI